MHKIAPSILSANMLKLEQEIEMINNSSADWFHLDVMDGRFVPNITFGMPIISAMKKKAKKPFDVHLMIVEPDHFFKQFAEAGADSLTIHFEISPNLHRSVRTIKSMGMKACVAINPHTPVSMLEYVIEDLDMVCVMSVDPGFGGQLFIESMVGKIRQLKHMILERGAQTLIEVDGGITLDNAHAILKTGADVLVAGNTVFASPDPKKTIQALKDIQINKS